MSEEYERILQEQSQPGIWKTLKEEATNLSPSDYAQLTADVAGIFDPTPVSDGAGAVISIFKGDFWGAGMSVAGMVPYVGDLAKIPKIAKLAPRTAKALELWIKGADNLAKAGKDTLEKIFSLKQIAAARKAAADKVREAMLKCRTSPNSTLCKKIGQLQMPRTGGKWNTPDGKAPDSGTGTWTFDQPKTLPDGRVVTSIEYKDGFPDFSQYTHSGKHDLWEVSGDATKDARSLHRENPELARPNKDDWVLHHFEDGSVGYVPRAIHDRGVGAAHSGGNSIVNNDLF